MCVCVLAWFVSVFVCIVEAAVKAVVHYRCIMMYSSVFCVLDVLPLFFIFFITTDTPLLPLITTILKAAILEGEGQV